MRCCNDEQWLKLKCKFSTCKIYLTTCVLGEKQNTLTTTSATNRIDTNTMVKCGDRSHLRQQQHAPVNQQHASVNQQHEPVNQQLMSDIERDLSVLQETDWTIRDSVRKLLYDNQVY